MKQLQIVDAMYVHQIWDKVNSFFEASYEQGPKDCTVEQLRMLLARGAQTLFVVVEDNNILGAFSVELVNHPNAKAAVTTAMGGKGLFTEETIAQYEDWARSQGATKIKAFAKEAQARLYKQKLGLETTMFVVEKAL